MLFKLTKTIKGMEALKFRSIMYNLPIKVKVYFNLHKKCFSVQRNGIVIAHTNFVALKNVDFKVSEAGRQRVLRNKKKSVHAFVVGELLDVGVDSGIEVTYNPYKYDSFVRKSDESNISRAEFAVLVVDNNKGKIYV